MGNKKRSVHQAARHTLQQRPMTLPSHHKTLRPHGATLDLTHKTTAVSPSMRRETDHSHSLRDGTRHRVRNVHRLGFGLLVVCSFFLALAAANFVSAGVLPSAKGSDVMANTLHQRTVILDGLLRGSTGGTVRSTQQAGDVHTGIWRIQHCVG